MKKEKKTIEIILEGKGKKNINANALSQEKTLHVL